MQELGQFLSLTFADEAHYFIVELSNDWHLASLDMLNPRIKAEYASALVEGGKSVLIVTQGIPELAHWVI